MWHKLPTASKGAAPIAAPLLIKDVTLRNYYQDIPCEEKLTAKLDTAASMSVIPIDVALRIGLQQVGLKEMQPFDHSVESKKYPTFYAEIDVPGWSPAEKMLFVGCPRDNVLLGLDIFKENLLLVNWKSGFGVHSAKSYHRPLEYLFTLRKKFKINADLSSQRRQALL